MSGMMETDHWFRRLDAALHSLPPAHREDIVREVRSHVEDRVAQGIASSSVIAALGQPEDYALNFVDDFHLSESLGARSVPRMLRVATRLAHKSVMVACGLILVLVLVLMGSATIVTAAMHWFDPAHWGLWLSDRYLIMGQVASGEPARELLGAAIYPVAVGIGWACWSASRWILQHVLRRRLHARADCNKEIQ